MAGASRVVVLAFVMFAMIGVACAADNSASPPTAGGGSPGTDEETIGSITDGAASSPNGVVAGPIGGPVPPGAFDKAKGTDPAGSSAATSSFHHFSALAGAASAALAGIFYF